MTAKFLGWAAVGLGVFGVILSLLVDILPNAKAGIQSAQILGIEISIAVLLIGLWILMSGNENKIELGKQFHLFVKQILDWPVIAWVLIGFLTVYVLFFISPIFFNETHRMRYFITYLPDRFPIGNDLIAVINLMKGWFIDHQSPYLVQFYPPFTYVFFAPLLLIGNYPTLFTAFTVFTITSYIFITLIIPLNITGQKNLSIILLLFLSGLVSYGFQFELERGQYNVFTFLLTLIAIYIFHYHRKYRMFAYLLFSIAIQLKLYPAIFIVMLVDNWADWKAVIRRFAGIGLFNFLLLFIMGWKIFLDFLGSVSTQLAAPGWEWTGNHSIKAFVGIFTKQGLGLIKPGTLEILQQNSNLISTLLLLIFLATLVTAILTSHFRGEQGLDPYLLLTCTIGALIIPISNDYTLSILAAPMAIFFSGIPKMKNFTHPFLSIPLVLGISIAYASTLIPFKYKPEILGNTFPALFLVLIFVTVLNLLRYKARKVLQTVQSEI